MSCDHAIIRMAPLGNWIWQELTHFAAFYLFLQRITKCQKTASFLKIKKKKKDSTRPICYLIISWPDKIGSVLFVISSIITLILFILWHNICRNCVYRKKNSSLVWDIWIQGDILCKLLLNCI